MAITMGDLLGHLTGCTESKKWINLQSEELLKLINCIVDIETGKRKTTYCEYCDSTKDLFKHMVSLFNWIHYNYCMNCGRKL